LIVSDQKVAAGAWLNVVVHGGGSIPVSVGPNGRCVPADTPTLKLDRVSKWGESVKEILPWSMGGASY